MQQLSSLITHCNSAQKEAILHCHSQGPLLILAGAGTGKTTVLSLRVAHLCQTGVNTESILALTFTQKAAAEMSERIGDLLQGHCVAPLSATFHSLAFMVLRESVAGVPNYSQVGLVKSPTVITESWYTETCSSLIQKYPHITQADFDTIKDDPFQKVDSENIYCTALALLRERCLIDSVISFDSMITLVIQLFESNTRVREHYQKRFEYILIDEYQDVNPPQYQLSRLLAGNKKSVFVVGDDDQAIYGFRGADIRNILEFKNDYPQTRIVKLEENYRSARPIIDLANQIFSEKDPEYRKQLITKCKRETPLFNAVLRVRRIYSLTGVREIKKITFEITQLKNRYGTTLEECAILVRLNSQVAYYKSGLRYFGLKTKEGKEEEGDAVIVQTLHASKGLQYPVVFYCGLSENLSPLEGRGEVTDSHIEEERRLFYVGVTRAESALYLMHSKKRVFKNKMKTFRPSQFLEHHKEGLFDKCMRIIGYWSSK